MVGNGGFIPKVFHHSNEPPLFGVEVDAGEYPVEKKIGGQSLNSELYFPFVRGLNSSLTGKNEDTTTLFFKLFGNRGQLSLGSVFFQYLSDLGGEIPIGHRSGSGLHCKRNHLF